MPSTEHLSHQADELRRLHRPGDPVLLANVWDTASAKMVEELGAAAIATSSAAVAATLGHKDTDSMPPDVAFGAVARVTSAVTLPVTADLEAGYQLSASEFVDRLLAAGAVGCNLEDTDHHSEAVLVERDKQARWLSDVKAAARAKGVDIVINARVDVFVRHVGEGQAQMDEGVGRASAYLDAGADCVYPIFLADEPSIATFVERVGAPVNIFLRQGATPSLARLKELGVARISLAGGVWRAAMIAARQAAQALLKPSA